MHFFNTQIKATKVVFYFVIPKLNRTFAKSFELHKGKIIFMNNYVSLNLCVRAPRPWPIT